MQRLVNKNIVLGVTGSIAAYKAAELVRLLRQAGAQVRVVLSAGGAEFVTPLTFQALSGNPVHTELLDTAAEAAMGHIELARWADAIVVAPASANFLARLAQGRADDLLAALCLASYAPIALAPAMNHQMWASAATQANVAQLQARGVQLFGPGSGDQACGETGPGRLLEPVAIAQHIAELFARGRLTGLTVMVTAGPTQEAIDPVRYLSNRSSGKMGFAVAQAAAEAGARVLLIAGPVGLATPPRVTRVDVRSAQDMLDAVIAQLPGVHIFIGVAAVADYRPAEVAAQKIKKTSAELTLHLIKTPDILATVAARRPAPFTVGFAAETHDVDSYARRKLVDKGVDMIAANLVSDTQGFATDDNALMLYWTTGQVELAQARKDRLARELIEQVAERYRARSAG